MSTSSPDNHRFGRVAVAVFTTLGIVGVHWLATSGEHLLHGLWEWTGHHLLEFLPDPEQGAVFMGALILIGLSSWVVFHFRHIFGPKQRAITRAKHDPKSCIIFLVSSENFRTGEPRLLPQESPPAWTLDGKPYLDFANLSGQTAGDRLKIAIDAASNVSPSSWPWQQLLRALPPHLDSLKEIWLVGSSGEKGSFRSLPRLRSFLSQLLGPDVAIYLDCPGVRSADWSEQDAVCEHARGVDFEDFGALVDRLQHLIQRITRDYRPHRQHEIVIDATGGQKTTSIAAAAATLNSEVMFQYVQTSPPWEPLIYDTVFQSPQAHGH